MNSSSSLALALVFVLAPQLAWSQTVKKPPQGAPPGKIKPSDLMPGDVQPADAPPRDTPPALLKPGRVVSRPAACQPLPENELVRLDFENAPLQDLVREVGRATCKNFVLEHRLARLPVMMVSAMETRAGALWTTFLSVLAANDLTLVDRAGHSVIVEATEATRSNVPGYGPQDAVPNEERMVTKIMEVKDRDLNAISNFLSIHKSPKGQVHPYLPGNILVITDYASSISRLEWLYRQMTKAPAKP